ncbi:MAG: tannase/feruloyl esterase family alpha/beta hydrolase, partial [Bradyrhizobiaceae bacterium]|nr:tannase/feruloyl esterase family alpha/beta hydrolase [Bradyrhizobiaceae bacterium]
MTVRLLFMLAIIALSPIAGPAGHAQAGTTCTGQIGGGPAVTNINGDVTVPEGASCTLSFVNVKGSIRVGRDASLTVFAYTEPSSIGGDIEASACNSVLLQGNVTVQGNLDIGSCNGTGFNGFEGPDTVINGSFECRSNAGPCLAWLGTVGENVHIQSNRSQTASDVSLVSVGGNLHCMGNIPAPTRSHGPSWVDGNAEGQCASFATTTTSIATPATPTPCANLASLPAAGFPVPNTVITSAVDTPAANGLPQRCIVNGFVNQHISPVDQCRYADAFQVQLPANWNGRFMMQGGGGTEGAVPAATGVTSAGSTFGIVNGYAVASQDGGHLNADLAATTCDSGFGNANEFYLDPLGTITQTYQSIEVTALVAKYLINRFYGDGPHHSYWVGCSTGGRQGMVMSQHFPTFFDGIIAGDPVYDLQAISLSETYGIEQILNVYTANPALPPISTAPQPAPQPPAPILFPAFPAADQALLETALLQVCDPLDGVADGVVDNLPACKAKFDPATATYSSGGATFKLQCTGAKNATCLSPAQIAAVKNIHQGPRNSRGQTITAPAGAVATDHVTSVTQGYAWDGGWMSTVSIPLRKIGGPTSPPGDFALGGGQFGYAFLSPPQPTIHTLDFNFDTDLGMLSQETPVVTFSTSADIRRFVNLGHKIIWYHGLSDPGPPVLGTIRYYQDMAGQHGGLDKAQGFSRFYPVPNMGHCSGGAATDQFDLLTPLADWVENGVAPGPVPATGVNFTPATYQVSFVAGPTTRSRPLCPYPQQARFIGSVSMVGGVPVATNQADLADPAKYRCISAPPP